MQDKHGDALPAEAEQSQVQAQEGGHHVSDEGTGFTGMEVDPEPHSHEQSDQLTRHEVHLHTGSRRRRNPVKTLNSMVSFA